MYFYNPLLIIYTPLKKTSSSPTGLFPFHYMNKEIAKYNLLSLIPISFSIYTQYLTRPVLEPHIELQKQEVQIQLPGLQEESLQESP